MMKKIISVFALVLISNPVLAIHDCGSQAGDIFETNCWDCAAADGSSSCTARLDANGTITVSGSGNMKNYSSDTSGKPNTLITDTPWLKLNVQNVIINGVSNVGSFAFAHIKTLQHVTLADTITDLGVAAFHNTSIQDINFPDSLTRIQQNVLSANRNLDELDLNKLQQLGNHALSSTNIHSLVIPPSVETIQDGAFEATLLEKLYCIKEKMADCQKALDSSKLNIKPTQYEKSGNDYLVYDDKGNIAGKYAGASNLQRGIPTETYKYDSVGHLVGIFDGNGQRTWGKKIYTVEEAMEATKNGDKFHVFVTYK